MSPAHISVFNVSGARISVPGYGPLDAGAGGAVPDTPAVRELLANHCLRRDDTGADPDDGPAQEDQAASGDPSPTHPPSRRRRSTAHEKE